MSILLKACGRKKKKRQDCVPAALSDPVWSLPRYRDFLQAILPSLSQRRFDFFLFGSSLIPATRIGEACAQFENGTMLQTPVWNLSESIGAPSRQSPMTHRSRTSPLGAAIAITVPDWPGSRLPSGQTRLHFLPMIFAGIPSWFRPAWRIRRLMLVTPSLCLFSAVTA